MFDGYLREQAARTGEKFVPFDPVADYTRYVDGKPRYDGVRSFLAARGIELPEGESGDPPGAETVRGLGNRKNELVLRLIREGGVEVFEGSVRYLEAARDAGLRRATRACAAPWSRRAPTPAMCWLLPASKGSSRLASTGWLLSVRGLRANQPPTPSSLARRR